MDAIEQLKQDVREGRIGVDRLIDVIEMQQRQLESALRRIEELEKKAGGTGTAQGPRIQSSLFSRGDLKKTRVQANDGEDFARSWR